MWIKLIQLESEVKKSRRPMVLWLAVLACSLFDYFHGTPQFLIKAEPISTTAILVSLAISAATTAASYVLQRLLYKAPVVKRGQRTGNELIQDSQYGSFINEIYGGPREDGVGGVKVGGNIIDCSTIRKVVTTTTEPTGGGGGKGGGGVAEAAAGVLKPSKPRLTTRTCK
jgi:hypothetical protein